MFSRDDKYLDYWLLPATPGARLLMTTVAISSCLHRESRSSLGILFGQTSFSILRKFLVSGKSRASSDLVRSFASTQPHTGALSIISAWF